mgnify:FL=1
MASDWTNNDGDNNDTALGFSLADVDTTPELLPPGVYPVACTRARVTTSKNNPSTKMAELEETITDGDGKGRKVWSRYVVAHEKNEVMARGRRDLAMAARTYGVAGDDLADFVGRECLASVAVEAGKDGYADRNKVTKRTASTASAPTPKASTPGAAKPASATAPSFLSQRRAAPKVHNDA